MTLLMSPMSHKHTAKYLTGRVHQGDRGTIRALGAGRTRHQMPRVLFYPRLILAANK